MSLFGTWKAGDGELTPEIISIVAYILLAEGDGQAEADEMDELLARLGRRGVDGQPVLSSRQRDMLDAALDYSEAHDVDAFLAQSAGQLTEGQALHILCNMAELAQADGRFDGPEAELIERFQRAWGVDPDRARAAMEVILLKSDRSVLSDPGHPANR